MSIASHDVSFHVNRAAMAWPMAFSVHGGIASGIHRIDDDGGYAFHGRLWYFSGEGYL